MQPSAQAIGNPRSPLMREADTTPASRSSKASSLSLMREGQAEVLRSALSSLFGRGPTPSEVRRLSIDLSDFAANPEKLTDGLAAYKEYQRRHPNVRILLPTRLLAKCTANAPDRQPTSVARAIIEKCLADGTDRRTCFEQIQQAHLGVPSASISEWLSESWPPSKAPDAPSVSRDIHPEMARHSMQMLRSLPQNDLRDHLLALLSSHADDSPSKVCSLDVHGTRGESVLGCVTPEAVLQLASV